MFILQRNKLNIEDYSQVTDDSVVSVVFFFSRTVKSRWQMGITT